MNLLTTQKTENELMVARGKGQGEEIVREVGINMYTLLYLKWITIKVLLYSIGNSAQCYVAAWMGGELREIDTYICMSSFVVHLKL